VVGGRVVAALGLALALGPGVLAACSPSVHFEDARPFPGGCVDVRLGEDQCGVLVQEAQTKLGIAEASIERVDMLTEDRCGPVREILCTRSLGFAAGVRFHLTDGTDRWATVILCPPGSPRMFCLVESD
jgi:hypothetical protein